MLSTDLCSSKYTVQDNFFPFQHHKAKMCYHLGNAFVCFIFKMMLFMIVLFLYAQVITRVGKILSKEICLLHIFILSDFFLIIISFIIKEKIGTNIQSHGLILILHFQTKKVQLLFNSRTYIVCISYSN